MNLVEYPLGLVSQRLPQVKQADGAYRELGALRYEKWVSIEGQKRCRRWIFTGSSEYGLPRGADLDVPPILFYLWYKSGFGSEVIPISNLSSEIFALLGWSDEGKQYERFIEALRRYQGSSIHSEYAFWDAKLDQHLPVSAFGIISSFQLRRREGRGGRDLIEGYIRMDAELHAAVLKGNLKVTNLGFCRKLRRGHGVSSGVLTRVTYRFLDKARWRVNTFEMHLVDFLQRIGFASETLKQYSPQKLKNLISPSVETLREHGFLDWWRIEQGSRGLKLVVRFKEGRLREKKTIRLDPEQALLVEDILEVTGDEHSRKFYEKLASDLPRDLILEALSETRLASRLGRIRTTSARYFTDLIGRRQEALRPAA